MGSRMQQHDSKYFAYRPNPLRPLGRDRKVKIQLFQDMVMLHIKLNGITNAATCKHTFCPYTHSRSLGWSQRSKYFFSESSHVLYQIKKEWSIEHHAIIYIYSVLTHTLDAWGGVKGHNYFLKVVMLHIRLTGMEHRASCRHTFRPYTPT